MGRPRVLFPPWFDRLVRLLLAVAAAGAVFTLVLVLYATSPVTTTVGYQPVQPVPYSHALHPGKLGLDCRYCHLGVEREAAATLPATQTCMNCHSHILTKSENLAPVRDSYASGMPIEWVKVHDLPDFVYFNHSAHVRRGVGCVECHGRVDQMTVVYQAKPLTMAWCLDCHRNPEPHLRPAELVTKMDWAPSEGQAVLGKRLRAELNINPPTDCSTCHR